MSTSTAFKNAVATMSVKVVSGPHTGDSFAINKVSFTIGRGSDNDIILINDPKLSRQHVRIKVTEWGVDIECLNSRNPILYKGKFLTKLSLKVSDRFLIGETELALAWEGQFAEKTQVAGTETMADFQSDKTQVDVADKNNQPDFDFNDLQVNKSMTPVTPAPSQPGLKLVEKPRGVKNDLNLKGGAKAMAPVVAQQKASPLPTLPPKSNLPGTRTADSARGTNSGKNNQDPYNSKQNLRKKSDQASLFFPILAILIVVVPLVYLNMDKPKSPTRLKDVEQLRTDLDRSTQTVQEYIRSKNLNEDGQMDRQNESAQSYYIKGFRDYRQGQYSRAISSFQATLSFNPNHVLARRYLNQSLKREAQLVQFSFDQARRYREKNNFRFCISSAQIVIHSVSLQPTDKILIDAKKILSECELLSKGRF